MEREASEINYNGEDEEKGEENFGGFRHNDAVSF